MSYQIKRNKNGWILNEFGEVLILDSDLNENIWVPNNLITFNNENRPMLATQGELDEHVHLEIHHETENQVQVTGDEIPEDTAEQAELDSKTVWGHNATLALIAAVEAHYEDLFHIKKKKTVWGVITQELVSQNFEYSEGSCKKKWANLLRSYKATKDLKKKTGRARNRFLFFEQMDAILGDTPTNASPHTIDVASIDNASASSSSEIASTSNTDSESTNAKKKRKNPTVEYVNFKREYYKKKDIKREEQLKEHIRLQQERLRLLEEKNEIEKRKVEALEKIASSVVPK